MRITYRQLYQLLTYLTEEQLDCDVTAEIPPDLSIWGTECYHADFRIAGQNHDSLDNGHPVFFVSYGNEDRTTKTIPEIAKHIGLVE